MGSVMSFESKREQFVERPLPSSEESERVVLGAVLLDQRLFPSLVEGLKTEDFYSPRHRRIFDAMSALFAASTEINPILIGEELKKIGLLESIGGISTITNLTYGLPHFSDLANYIKVIKEKAQLRGLIRACNEITEAALNEEASANTILDSADQKIFELRIGDFDKGESVPFKIAVERAAENAQAHSSNDTGVIGLSTGLRDLDEKLSGLKKKDLIIIAARPSMGKSALALSIMRGAASGDKDAEVLVFDLETSAEKTGARAIATEAKVDLHRFNSGYLTREEWGRVAFAVSELSDAKITIEDCPSLTVMEMKAKARRFKAQKRRLDLIVVDYLQLMSASKKSESRQQEVSQISRELKALAKEMNVPVVALSQLSRAVETRKPPIPMMSDLRESGAIEQDADVVAFIYREEYYFPTDENAGVAEVIVAKNRNGPVGTVKLVFLKEFVRFESYYGN